MGDGKHIIVKEKDTISFPTCHGTKLIIDFLYVLDIDKNLLSVGQMVEKGYKVLFNNDCCLIKYANDNYIFRIKMKSFVRNPMEEEQNEFSMTQVELNSLNVGKAEQESKTK